MKVISNSLNDQMAEFFDRDSREKLRIFFDEFMDKNVFKLLLAYLNDIFCRLNLLNKSLQGRFTTVIDFVDKIRAFIMKSELWEAKVNVGKFRFS